MTHSDESRHIPADSFRIRLAIVRAQMGWNYDQAQAATGVGSESWRLWEKGRRCTDVIGVSRRISEATGFDQSWLALGGPLAPEEVAPTHRVSPQQTRGFVSTEPEYSFAAVLPSESLAA